MNRSATRAIAALLGLLPALYAHAQSGNAAATPAPGLTTLAAVGEQREGLWVPVYGRPNGPSFDVDAVRFKPWAKGLYDARQEHDLEPHARCKASGAVRQFLTPYGVDIVEIEELERLYIFDIGGPHTFREVYMDGRSHPTELTPTYYGHNIGWWDGDTLVIDSVGYSEDFWFERAGLPHTESAHVIETFRRPDAETLEYHFTLEDPAAYDSTVEGRMTLRWQEGAELFEYMCQQGNYAFDLMVHPEDMNALGRTSQIVP